MYQKFNLFLLLSPCRKVPVHGVRVCGVPEEGEHYEGSEGTTAHGSGWTDGGAEAIQQDNPGVSRKLSHSQTPSMQQYHSRS